MACTHLQGGLGVAGNPQQPGLLIIPGWEALPAFRSMMSEQMLSAQAVNLTDFAIPHAGHFCLALLVLACIHGTQAQNMTLCWGE